MRNGFKSIILAIGILALALLHLPESATAQTGTDSGTAGTESTADLPPALQPDAIRALTEKLTTEQVEALAELLAMVGQEGSAEAAKEAAEGANPFMKFLNMLQLTGNTILSNASGLGTIFVGIGETVTNFVTPRGASGTLMFLLLTAVAIGLGVAAELGASRLTRDWRHAISLESGTDNHETLTLALKSLTRRFFSETLNLIAFIIVAEIAARLLLSDPLEHALAAAFIFYAIFIVRMFTAIMRFVLAPERAEMRLVTIDDAGAAHLFWNLTAIAGVVGGGLFFLNAFNLLDAQGGPAFRFWVGIGLYIWLIILTWQARAGLASILIGDDEHLTEGLKRLANWWPYISIGLLVLNWVITRIITSSGVEITDGQGVITVALIVLAPFLDTLVRGIVGYLTPPMEGEGAVAEKAYHRTRLSYVRIGRLALMAVLIIILARTWGLNLRNLAEAGFGAKIAANSVEALLLLAFGYLAWEVANLWINRRLARETTELDQDPDEPGGGEGGGTGLSRMATILPLFRVFIQATIIVLVALLFLSQLGFNIGPLLAGAGVIGLAIGFGAQTLVKDVVSGMFFLLDDAFRVGEFVVVGDTVGSVEKISIRSFQLRHPNGPVHTIPYGEIQKLTNNSRDWIIMKLRFTVPFDTDTEKVRKLFKKIGQEMMEEPAMAEHMIQPFKSQGVYEVDDVGIVIRGKFMTEPGHQFIIRKQIYARVQKAFEENGIEFARKEVRVKVPGLEENTDLSTEQKEAIAGAASDAAETADAGAAAAPADDR